MDHGCLIEKLGGPLRLARRLKLGDNRALHWRERGVPYHHIPAVVEEARKEGVAVTTEQLIASKPRAARQVA